jgi:hypothetical protein
MGHWIERERVGGGGELGLENRRLGMVLTEIFVLQGGEVGRVACV